MPTGMGMHHMMSKTDRLVRPPTPVANARLSLQQLLDRLKAVESPCR